MKEEIFVCGKYENKDYSYIWAVGLGKISRSSFYVGWWGGWFAFPGLGVPQGKDMKRVNNNAQTIRAKKDFSKSREGQVHGTSFLTTSNQITEDEDAFLRLFYVRKCIRYRSESSKIT